MTAAEAKKAITGFVTAAIAVEAAGVFTGVGDHYLKLGISAAVAALGVFGFVFTVPNSPKPSVSQGTSEAEFDAL